MTHTEPSADSLFPGDSSSWGRHGRDPEVQEGNPVLPHGWVVGSQLLELRLGASVLAGSWGQESNEPMWDLGILTSVLSTRRGGHAGDALGQVRPPDGGEKS